MAQATNIEWTDLSWNPVPSHPGYEVSFVGQIRGPSGRVLRPMRDRGGYLYVLTSGSPRKLFVHRAVLLAFGGAPPFDGAVCRHLDDDQENNRADNLVWGTHADNAADRLRNGGYTAGEERANARLTAEQARAIRDDSRSSRTVAADYGVSHTAVQRIRRGEKWRAA